MCRVYNSKVGNYVRLCYRFGPRRGERVYFVFGPRRGESVYFVGDPPLGPSGHYAGRPREARRPGEGGLKPGDRVQFGLSRTHLMLVGRLPEPEKRG